LTTALSFDAAKKFVLVGSFKIGVLLESLDLNDFFPVAARDDVRTEGIYLGEPVLGEGEEKFLLLV
jgi:hypothetical protein